MATLRSALIHPLAAVAADAKVRPATVFALLCTVAMSATTLAQMPVVLPNTISSVAGGGSAATKSSPCPGASNYTATDSLGDGCPATSVSLGVDEWGLGVDKFGNVFSMDNNSTNSVVHEIDARSGLLVHIAGLNTTPGCSSGQQSGLGDGCIAATQTGNIGARNMSVDPWGNVIIPDYSRSVVHIVCNTVSPLCGSANSLTTVGVGYMAAVAGYLSSSSSAGGGTSGVSGTTAGSAGDGTLAVSAVSTTGVAGPRGGTADKFGNVYIADTANGRFRVVLGPQTFTPAGGSPITNPLWAVIQSDSTYPTAHMGYIYPILGGFTAVAKGNTCGSATSLDAQGDGCPFFNTSAASSPYGVTSDAAGDAIFADTGNKLIRVLYLGGTQMAALIALENPGVTPIVGSVYALAGGGAHGVNATPVLGTGNILNGPNSVAVDANGNIYAGETSKSDVLFLDINTGFARVLFVSGTACSAKTDSMGDGCPVNQASYGGETYTIPIGLDPIGNLYMGDQTNSRIRKVSASSLMPMTVGTAATQTLLVHAPAGTTGIAAALSTASPDVSLGSPACGTVNGDNTLDCTVAVSLTPSAPSFRSTALAVTPSGSSTASIFPMAGLSTGSALVADSVSSSSTGSVLSTTTLGSVTPLAVAVDGSNNVYSVSSSSLDFNVYLAGGAGSTLLSSAAPTGVSQIAVDTQGNLYAVGSGSASITKLTVTAPQSPSSAPPTYTAGTVPYPAVAPTKPQGIAVDGEGNLYVSDGSTKAVYKFSPSSTYVPMQTVASGFGNPTLLAVDNFDNVFIYDAGVGSIIKYIFPYTSSTTIVPSVTATGLATDAAGDLYVQTVSGVTEYPVSGASPVTVYSGGSSPNGIATDGSGNLYLSDAGNAGIVEVKRGSVSYNFGTGSSGSPTLTGTLTNAGNQAVTGSSNLSNFTIAPGSSNGCNFSASLLGSQAIGNACSFAANFVGTGSGTVNNTFTYLPTSTVGSLSLSGTLTGLAIATTTTISAPSPSNPSYSPSAAEVTFTVTVVAQSGSSPPTGVVAITVDSGAPTNYPLTAIGSSNPQGATATVALAGLTATNHTISATYPTTGSFTTSSYSGNPVPFSIAADSPVAVWTPVTNSGQYSAPIGTSVLNATATFNSAPVPGTFVYKANGNEINPASYLLIGTYTLSATFYPIDNVDYTTATVSGGTFTVSKASTTAAVGTTQNLVASDSTGNFTNVQAAINSLPSTGGSVYIKPGTYAGFLTVVQPNVALRGLGGDPTQVILTHEAGAFGSTYPYTGEFQATGISAGNGGSNGWQLPNGSTISTGDSGSSTLFVARAVNTAVSSSTLTPINFYAENLSLINAYNTDTTTTTTTYEPTTNGTCTVLAGPPQTYSYLYNNQFECGSQALAIWIESDQAVLNNVYTTSQQDTIYAGAISTGGGNSARQYWFRGKVTGDVDFIFGDAAAVFDHTTVYTTYHGNTATGTETIEAQNKANQTGGSSDYLSGYIMDGDIFTSQSPGMTNLFFGRPYANYSTWVMLNSYVDQVNATGYTTGLGPSLTDATYAEYNDQVYTDPATGSRDTNGIIYLGAGGNTGSGVASTRETISTNPGTLESAAGGFQANYPTFANTTLSPAEAQQYYPMAFLGATVPTSTYNTVTNWNPTAAIAADVNAFVPSGTSATITAGSSVTILMRPQTPGLGAVTNGVYTIPTGTYTLTDSVNGGASITLASGTLDAAGEAYYTSSTLTAGTHNLTWTYSGDSNFSGSTTASAYVLTVTGSAAVGTTTAFGATVNPIGYGQSASITATVSPASGTTTPAGSVNLTIDGTTTLTAPLSSGTASFTVTGLGAGGHVLSATYTGATAFGPSSTSPSGNLSLTVNKAALTVTGSCSNRIFGQANVCSALVTGGYQYSDSAATVFTSAPTGTTTAARNSPAASYTATPVYTPTAFGSTNYTIAPVNSSFTVAGGAAQSIIFAPLPNFAHGASYQLTARSTSGLPVSYSIISTSGNASVSGSTLTVTGTGSVTVQASQSIDPTGDYAAATPVSMSFTAQ